MVLKTKNIIIPNFTDISPIAHVALLQTDIESGFKFLPKIGINWAKNKTKIDTFQSFTNFYLKKSAKKIHILLKNLTFSIFKI